jgi:hypothetical protein
VRRNIHRRDANRSQDPLRAFIEHSSGIWNFAAEVVCLPSGDPCEKGTVMKKTLAALVAVATLAASAVAPAPAEARGGFGAGVAAGLIGGAIVGGAIAGAPYGYGYGPGYYAAPGPYYYGPGYVADPGYVEDPGYACYLQRQRFWDGYAWRIRRVRVCE